MRNPIQYWWLGAACLLAGGPLAAEDQPPMKELSPGVFQMGGVKLDKTTRTVTFPAEINMRDALIEYFLVTKAGKTHESLLATDIDPSLIHMAMLLLGAKPTGQPAAKPPAQIDASYLKKAPKPVGDKVDIHVSWQAGAKEEWVRAEQWIMNTAKKAPMENGPWIYTGSVLSDGQFRAQDEGSIIAVITDPSALVNNPRPDDTNDLVWIIRSKEVPPVGTPVEVSITLNPKK